MSDGGPAAKQMQPGSRRDSKKKGSGQDDRTPFPSSGSTYRKNALTIKVAISLRVRLLPGLNVDAAGAVGDSQLPHLLDVDVVGPDTGSAAVTSEKYGTGGR